MCQIWHSPNENCWIRGLLVNKQLIIDPLPGYSSDNVLSKLHTVTVLQYPIDWVFVRWELWKFNRCVVDVAESRFFRDASYMVPIPADAFRLWFHLAKRCARLPKTMATCKYVGRYVCSVLYARRLGWWKKAKWAAIVAILIFFTLSKYALEEFVDSSSRAFFVGFTGSEHLDNSMTLALLTNILVGT